MRFPHKVHSGSVFVSIYREKRKGGYTTYLLRWKQGGAVMKEAKNDLHEALKRAKEVADLIAEGRAEMTDITALQREIYADLEKKIEHTGLSLAQVVERFVESWEPEVTEVTVKQAFESYKIAKKNLSLRHQKDIKQRIGALAERTTAAMAHLRRHGKRISSRIPLGFDLADDGENLIENPAEQLTIRQILEWRSAGVAVNGIAQRLQARGVKTKMGGQWRASTVKFILDRQEKLAA